MILKYNHENLEIKNLFTNTIRQLEYMKETFNILNSTFCTEFNELYRQYEKDYNNFVKNTYREPLNYEDIKSGHERDTIQWDEIENDMNFLYKDSFEIHENINTIVIEALIIKINAIIEKFLLIYHGLYIRIS